MSKEDLILNSTWKRHKTPRGKKVTVSLYLSQNLVERARKQGLKVSRISEQALSSILDYVQPQTSSQFLASASFLKEAECRGPGLNRRQPGLQPGALPG